MTSLPARYLLRVLGLAATILLAACSSERSVQVYCYRSLADIDCLSEPDPTRARLFVGTYVARVPKL